MSERIIDYDPLTGESVTFKYNHGDDSFTIGHVQDCSHLIEHNKLLAADTEYTKRGIKESWLKYASIPNVVYMNWKQQLGVDLFNRDHMPKVMQLLNSPEYKFLKTTAIYHDK